jgi:Protein of unknown function (DUF1097)
MMSTRIEHVHRQAPRQFLIFTLVAATVAASAAAATEALTLEVWAMFAGFIAWFTRPTSSLEGVWAMTCLWLGIGLAAVSHLTTGALIPAMGSLALPAVVFLVALIVVGLRTTSVVNNMLAWFLGMVTCFATESDPAREVLLHLTAATSIGGFSGWICQQMNRRWAGA